MKKIIFFIIFFLCWVQWMPIIAQTGTFYSTDNVLSNSLINSIYQDSRNYIWIATEDGLNKFDGVRFSIYHTRKEDRSALKNNYVRTLFEDSKGRFWVGCINGLMLYDRAEDKFTEVPIHFHNQLITPHITSIIETRKGEILIATSGAGIIRSTDNYKTFNVDESLFPKLCSRYLISLYQDRRGLVWIASENQGLNQYNPQNSQIKSFKAPLSIGSNQISSICGDDRDNVFVGTLTGGLFCFNQSLNKFDQVSYINPTITLPVKSLLFDSNKRLLVGTDGRGIKYLNKTTGRLEDYQILTAMFDFSRTKIHALCQDRVGNLWVGLFQKGIFLSPNHPNKFHYWGIKSFSHNVIGSNCVMSVLKDNEGTMWVGTDNDGLYGLTGNLSRHFDLRSKSNVSNTVMSILEGDKNTLWLASYLDGLVRFDKHSGNITRFANNSPELSNNTSSNKAMSIAHDEKNRIWVGTNGAGVQVFDINSSKYVAQYMFQEADSSGIANNWVNCVKQDGYLMWIGTYGGVSSVNLRSNRITTFRTKNNILPGNIVLAIAKDHRGNMWFGTTEGLACYNQKTGKSIHYSTKDGLAGNVICGIMEDAKGNLWISTHSGISKFIPESNKFANHYAYDGLQGNEFSTGAVSQASDGEMIFGGVGGVSSFYPSLIADKRAEVKLFLTGLYVFDKKVVKGMKSGWNQIIDCFISDANKIRLSYKDNMFTLEFSTFDFGSPESVYYRYKMEGLNDQWISTEKGVNRISFTNLNYGHYKLKIKACVNNQESAEKVLEIIIYPPWYLCWLAKIVYLGLFVFLGWIVFRVLLDRFNHKQEMLRREHLEQVNEGKLQFFINISHEIRTPMSLIISPLEKLLAENRDADKQAVYQLMYRNAQRILRLINQLLDIRKIDKGQMFVKMSETDVVGFVDDLMTTFDYQAKRHGINFAFNHPMPELMAWIDVNNFDKVLVNILSNAFKFTPENGEIIVTLKTGENELEKNALRHYFEIVISDNGIGLEEDKIEKIFERFYQIDNSLTDVNFGTGIGLHLAKNLVELMHGEIIACNKAEGKGSEFIIRLPLGDAHLTQREREYGEILQVSAHVERAKNLLADEEADLKVNKIKAKTKYRILIVEDEREIRQYLRNELADTYRISECENGKEALDFILKEKPDLVISDVMMPEMDGITLCKKLKSNININHIPIILLTAKSSDEDKAEGFDIGADAYFAKPFNVELLKKCVANIIENRERLEYKAVDNEENKALIKPVVLKANDQVLYEKIMKIINENISDSELNVEMLAVGVGMSRVHMHRKLKELTNMSARDFIKSIRLKQAADLLSNQKLTVSEVAYALGFSNLSHFSNSFREFYGMSPKEYAHEHWKLDESTPE
jgi:signal transduction histidine kinase/ligand-binding sensor domain-containing protein/DNA-binding response OmpR family regulator